MSFVYLATPYSHDSLQIRTYRYQLACIAIHKIAVLQVPVYSPIVHWHSTAISESLPTDYKFWQTQNDAMLLASREVWVLCMDGWRQSKGIEYEINFATERNIKLRHVTEVSLSEAADLYKTALR